MNSSKKIWLPLISISILFFTVTSCFKTEQRAPLTPEEYLSRELYSLKKNNALPIEFSMIKKIYILDHRKNKSQSILWRNSIDRFISERTNGKFELQIEVYEKDSQVSQDLFIQLNVFQSDRNKIFEKTYLFVDEQDKKKAR